jgi:putative transposase
MSICIRTWGLRFFRHYSGLALSVLHVLAAALPATFKSRAELQLENLALRHQLVVLQRSVKRPRLMPPDRLLWAWLCEIWTGWQSALVIVKPETVIAWHRAGFRLFWTWKVRHGQPGRPAVPKDVGELIRTMFRENPLWGAPRIHGELLNLGIDVGETSVDDATRLPWLCVTLGGPLKVVKIMPTMALSQNRHHGKKT